MLESSNRVRRSQRSSPRQVASASPPPQSASRPPEGGQRRSAHPPRSGWQRLLAGLLSLGAGSSRQTVSRRERLRQRRESSMSGSAAGSVAGSVAGVEPMHRSQTAIRTGTIREQGIPQERLRSEAVSGKRTARNEPAPQIRRTARGKLRDGKPGAAIEAETAQRLALKQRVHSSSQSSNQSSSHKVLPAKPRRSFSMSAFTQGMRLVILGVGVWAIVGTALSVWDPSARSGQVSQAASDSVAQAEAEALDTPSATNLMSQLHLGQEMSPLGTRVAPLTQAMSDLIPGVFVMDLDSGDYFSLNGETAFPAASMIKVPILVAFFQDVDAGKIQLNEVLTLQQPDLASGSGEMQYAGMGTQYSALETATNMIINSDNTATNMIMRRLGGVESLNQRFRDWGLQQTVLHNPLPDLEGTNMLSPKELSTLIARVSEGELVSLKSRDRLFNIMQRTVNNSLLPAALGEGATIAHKTGDIGSLAGDTGLVDLPNGKRYAISVMVKRPHNDARAYELVVQIGGAVYEYLSQATGNPATIGNPASYPSVATPTGSPTAPASAAVGSGASR